MWFWTRAALCIGAMVMMSPARESATGPSIADAARAASALCGPASCAPDRIAAAAKAFGVTPEALTEALIRTAVQSGREAAQGALSSGANSPGGHAATKLPAAPADTLSARDRKPVWRGAALGDG